MSWIILFVPIIATSIGIALWLDIPINQYRTQFLKFSEKSEDKTKIRERLDEIGNRSTHSYGEFRLNQFFVSVSMGMVPLIAAALLIINLVTALGLSAFIGIMAFLLYDRYLDSQVTKHRENI